MTSNRRLRVETFCFAVLAVLVGILTFVPWAAWLGYARESEVAGYSAEVWSWIRWSAGILVLAAGLSAVARQQADATLERWLTKARAIPSSGYMWTCVFVSAVVGALLSNSLFANNPHLVDSIAQLFQARIFLSGALTAPAPDHYEFFAASHLITHEGRWFSQYPPGHPALLVLGLWAGAPWLINPLFTAGTVALLFATARRLLGDGEARLSLLLFLLSPFALFMGASYMNHATTGFFLALALYGAVRSSDAAAGYRWALLAGLGLGLAATIRPLEAAAWAGVLGVWLMLRRGWTAAVVAACACLISLIPLLTYNALTTGEPLRFGYTLLWGPGHGLGFHTDPWGEPFTPLKSFALTALDFQRLNSFVFGWPFPSLLFAVAALGIAAIDARRRKTTALLAGLLLAAPVAYFFYWHRDNFLGPRFLYPSLLPVVLLTVVGISEVDRRLGRWRGALRLTVLAALAYSFTLFLPRSAGIVAGRMPGMKLHPEVEAAAAGIQDAVVFVKVGWGSRLIGRLWGWGISASDAEQTFRAVDGCRLQFALDQADSLVTVGADSALVRRNLTERLRVMRAKELPVSGELLADPTVRVDTTRALAGRCTKEAVRDESGFTLYGSLVWRNDPWLRRGVIYARDLGPRLNHRIMNRYPDRESYHYAPVSSDDGARPVLTPLVKSPIARRSRSGTVGGAGGDDLR